MIKHFDLVKKRCIELFSIIQLFAIKYRYEIIWSRIVFIIVAPICLILLPPDFFDEGRSICISKLVFGIECYGCGMTRAVMHLIHMEFEQAFAYNMLSFIVLPLLIIVWIQWFNKEWQMLKKLRTKSVAS